jgi:hypothetical protein
MRRFAFFFAAATAAFVAAGCGSSNSDPFGPAPDVSQIRAQFAHPTGTFAKGQESNVVNNYGSQQSAPGFFGYGQVSSGGSATIQAFNAIRPQGGAASSSVSTWCSAMKSSQSGSCSCPGGGTFYWSETGSGSQQSAHAVVRAKLQGCTVESVTEDGEMYAEIDAQSTGSGSGTFDMLIDFHAKVSSPAASATIDMDVEMSNNAYSFLVKVDDGVVSIRGGGTTNGQQSLTVTDKNATYTCTSASGHGSCTSSSGETRSW